MHFENGKLVFNTGREIPVSLEMYSISQNGIFKTIGHDQVIQDHKLTKKEVREVVNDLINTIDNLQQSLL